MRQQHLGQHESDELRYIGKVGTGFTRKSSIENRRKLDAITTAKSPLTKPVRTVKLRGVEPKYVADVEYRDGAAEGYLRHSSFKGVESRPDALRSSPRSWRVLRRFMQPLQLVADLSQQVFPPRNVGVGFDTQRRGAVHHAEHTAAQLRLRDDHLRRVGRRAIAAAGLRRHPHSNQHLDRKKS